MWQLLLPHMTPHLRRVFECSRVVDLGGSMGGRSPAFPLVFALAVKVCTWPQAAADIVFPEDQSEGCTLQNGEQGHCVDIYSCPDALDTLHRTPPVICGFVGDSPVVCCPKEDESNPLLDISPPIVNFECGQNPLKNVVLQEWLPDPPQILRPETPNSTAGGGSIASQEEPRIRPGIPQDARDKHYEEIAALQEEGIFSAVGGVPANKSAWPWMALIGEKDPAGTNWFCGGVLINDRWILSALHCFIRKKAEVVRLGEHDYNDLRDGADHEDFGVAETVLFPDYVHPHAYHDLALLRLANRVALNEYISPVCLPWGKEVNTDLMGRKVTLAGWGDTLYGGFPSSILQEVNVTVFASSKCDKSYSSLLSYRSTWPQGIKDETICAGDPNGGRDACQGDSGGPIVYLNSAGSYTVAGIVSRGHGCGLKDYPGLYVNLHQPSYLAWIKKTAF